jgi:hypothetical protein
MYILAEPPKVTVINETNHFGKTRLDCLARGIPALYNFSKWEHKSMFGEHIRYLDGFDNAVNLCCSVFSLEYKNKYISIYLAKMELFDLRL